MASRPVILKVLCALSVGCLLLPLGQSLFPYLNIPAWPFDVMEAVLGATLGLGIGEWLA
jgi:hypothetical protein